MYLSFFSAKMLYVEKITQLPFLNLGNVALVIYNK